jgi:hypothetical protein
MATVDRNSANNDYTNLADGYELSGGTTVRKLTVKTGDVVLIGATGATMTARNRISSIGNNLVAFGLTAQTFGPTATQVLAGSLIQVPVDKLQKGVIYKLKAAASKTAAGTLAVVWDFRIGLTGATADQSICSFSMPVGTAAADAAMFDLFVTIRGLTLSTCVAQGHLSLNHNLAATGFSTIGVNINTTSGVFDATVANLIMCVSVTIPGLTVWTFEQVFTEVLNL